MSLRYPPILVRLLARHKWSKPLTDQEIADRSGLPPVLVTTISYSTDWAGIDMPTMQKFLVACGVDFESYPSMKRIDGYMASKPTWKYLRTAPNWKTYYEPLIIRWRNAYLAGKTP